MTMLEYIVAIVIADAIICAILSSYLAHAKGYEAVNWCFVGLFLGIFGLIAAAGLPIKSYVSKLVKKCPECVEMIKPAASVCRYCGHRFDKNDIVSVLEETLLNGRYDDRYNAASDLINIGTVPALISVIEEPPGVIEKVSDGLVTQAAELLIEKADSSMTQRLIKLLNESRNRSTVLAAIQILTKIKDADAIRALVAALAKHNLIDGAIYNLSDDAMFGLEKIGEEAIPYLQEAVEQDEGIRKHAQKVIDKIQKAG